MIACDNEAASIKKSGEVFVYNTYINRTPYLSLLFITTSARLALIPGLDIDDVLSFLTPCFLRSNGFTTRVLA